MHSPDRFLRLPPVRSVCRLLTSQDKKSRGSLCLSMMKRLPLADITACTTANETVSREPRQRNEQLHQQLTHVHLCPARPSTSAPLGCTVPCLHELVGRDLALEGPRVPHLAHELAKALHQQRPAPRVVLRPQEEVPAAAAAAAAAGDGGHAAARAGRPRAATEKGEAMCTPRPLPTAPPPLCPPT